MRRAVRAVAVCLLVTAFIFAAVVPPIRIAMLQRAGHLLADADAVAAGDVLAMDVESGLAGALKIADLYDERPATIGILVPQPTAVEAALRQRGVTLPNVIRDTLVQLGVPVESIVEIPAGAGGTTETAAALAAWASAHRAARVVVVVGPSHGRRYRRALLRVWPDSAPAPRVVTTPYGLFRADNWWQSRTTLRDGLVEFEKLLLDYVAHPF